MAYGSALAGALLLDLGDEGFLQDAEPGRRVELLVALLSPLGLIRGLVDKEHRKAADNRAKQIMDATKEGKSVGAAVPQSVRAVQAAIMTSVRTPVIVSTTSN